MNKDSLWSWYYRHIKFRKMFKRQERILKVMQKILHDSAYPYEMHK